MKRERYEQDLPKVSEIKLQGRRSRLTIRREGIVQVVEYAVVVGIEQSCIGSGVRVRRAVGDAGDCALA